jgi:hypothetical protein
LADLLKFLCLRMVDATGHNRNLFFYLNQSITFVDGH